MRLLILLIVLFSFTYAYADSTYIYLIPENGYPPSSHWSVQYTKPDNSVVEEYHHGQGGKLFDIKPNTQVKIYQKPGDIPPNFYFIFSDGSLVKQYTFNGSNVSFYYKTVLGTPGDSGTGNGTGVIGTQYFVKVYKNLNTKSIDGILGNFSSKNNQTFVYSIYDYYTSATVAGNVTLKKGISTVIQNEGDNISHRFLVTLYDGQSLFTFILDAEDNITVNPVTTFTTNLTHLLALMFGAESLIPSFLIISLMIIGLDFYYSSYLGVLLAVSFVLLMIFVNPTLSEYNIPISGIFPAVGSLCLLVIIASQYIRNER